MLNVHSLLTTYEMARTREWDRDRVEQSEKENRDRLKVSLFFIYLLVQISFYFVCSDGAYSLPFYSTSEFMAPLSCSCCFSFHKFCFRFFSLNISSQHENTSWIFQIKLICHNILIYIMENCTLYERKNIWLDDFIWRKP